MANVFNFTLSHRRRILRRPREITNDDIDDFFTQLPEPETPAISLLIGEVEQGLRLTPQTLEIVAGEEPTTLFLQSCRVIVSDLRTLAVCKERLPRTLLEAVKHLLPIPDYLRFKSATVKCLCCQEAHQFQPRQCPQCSRLSKREAIRTMIVTGQLWIINYIYILIYICSKFIIFLI